MKPATDAGRRLLERETLNSRSFALITVEDIVAIEREMRDMVISDVEGLGTPDNFERLESIRDETGRVA